MKKAVIPILAGLSVAACQIVPSADNQPLILNTMAKNIRPAAVAGQFYPDTKAGIDAQFADFLTANPDPQKSVEAVVVPHAGAVYSGKVAGRAFSYLQGKTYKKVIIIAPSHYVSFAGISVGDFSHYQTPLGPVPVSVDVKKLLTEENFQSLPAAHNQEHAIEVELPFLQKTLDNFEIIPLVAGDQTTLAEIKEIAITLRKYVDDSTLVVISADFTHYGPHYGFTPFVDNISENLDKLDQPAIDYLKEFQTDELFRYLSEVAVTNDGQVVLTLLSEMFTESADQVETVGRETSGRITGDYTNSVSYVSLIVWRESSQALTASGGYSAAEKDYLLKLARQALENYYQAASQLSVNKNEVPEKLKEERGVFVTLEKSGNLRGCIGYILPNSSIYQSVIDNALNAALDDPRFNPVAPKELPEITIEISILSLPTELSVSNPLEYLKKLRPKTDGVIIKQGRYQATYLPQVWEDLSNPEEFLGSLCQKAGLDSDCWQEPSTTLMTYQAEVFSEESNKR